MSRQERPCVDSYADIIGLTHHVSKHHPQMPMADRAAQFSPFAALTGYDDAVQETMRLTKRRIELDEYERQRLDERLQHLMAMMAQAGEPRRVRITYFCPDAYKEGGSYETVSGYVRKVDTYKKCICLTDGREILINDILELE